MFEVFDRIDNWRVVVPTMKEGFIAAINHCVVEGLKIVDILDMGIWYEDPDTQQLETITVWRA